MAFLEVWSFGGIQFSTFLDGNSLQDGGTEAKPVFGWSQLERRICKEREDIFELAEFMAFSTASYFLRWLEIVFIFPRLVLQILFQIQFGSSYQCEIYHRNK